MPSIGPGLAKAAVAAQIADALTARSYTQWARALESHLRDTERIVLFEHAATKTNSEPGESERDFRVRVLERLHAERDERADDLRRRYAPKLGRLQERIRTAEHRVERDRDQVRQQGFQTALSIGASVLGAFLGRKAASVGNLGRATSAARSAGRIVKERGDVERAEEKLEALAAELAELDAEFTRELEAAERELRADEIELETREIRPTKASIEIVRVAFVWSPYWSAAGGARRAAWA